MRRHKYRKQLSAGMAFLRKQKKKGCSDPELEQNIYKLDQAIDQANWRQAKVHGALIRNSINAYRKKNWIASSLYFLFSLAVAIFIAAVVRQMWFEHFQIPTGSMRPTFKEKDCVIVSKSTFGLNIPFVTKHFLFSAERIQRGNIVVITTDGLDMADLDTMYFGLFPGKKRYVKRFAALPGDKIYFYGGDLYFIEKNGLSVQNLHATLPEREYIPFISSFEGRVETQRGQAFVLKHLNQPVGRVEIQIDGSIHSQINYNGQWIPEFSKNTGPRTLGEFWGIKNYALCRLISPDKLPEQAKKLGYSDPHALLWLELHHSPTLPSSQKRSFRSISLTSSCKTWIPLHVEHIERLKNGLYTARFIVENGRIYRYHYEGKFGSGVPYPKSIPNGCYEFYHGKAYSIGFGGTASELAPDHPIYPKTSKELSFWFNAGIEPTLDALTTIPTRFAYYNEGNLFVMGTPTYYVDDPLLASFDDREVKRQASHYNYFAFQDPKPPSFQEIEEYGFQVPDGHYLLLGDNPAMSVDCRYFGPVPQENIEGSPLILHWPFGSRWGSPSQPALPASLYSLFLFLVAGVLYYTITRWQKKRLHKELNYLREKFK